MGTWGNPSGITPLLSELQVLLAKTSCAYNPIIYCLSHPKFREVGFFKNYDLFKNNVIVIYKLLQILKKVHPWICIVVDNKNGKGDNNSIVSSKTELSNGDSESA